MSGKVKKLYVGSDARMVLDKCVEKYAESGGVGLTDSERQLCSEAIRDRRLVHDTVMLVALRRLLSAMVGEEEATAFVKDVLEDAPKGARPARRSDEPAF